MVAIGRRDKTVRHLGRAAQFGLQDKESTVDVADPDHATGIVGIVAPGAIEVGAVAGRIGVEEGRLAQRAAVDLREVEDAQAALVVRLVGVALVHVHVVVDRGRGTVVEELEMRSLEILHVPDVGARVVAVVLLVELVVDEEMTAVVGQPTLVGIARSGVAGARQLLRAGLVAHVNDGQRVLVRGEADFVADEIRIGPVVVDALGVMGIAVRAETAGKGRHQRIVHVDHVQARAALLGALARADRIGKPGRFVDDDIVGTTEVAVPRILGEGRRRRGDRAQVAQVEDLQAMVGGFGHDQRVVAESLDVAPGRVDAMRGQVAEPDGMFRVRDIDERGAVVEADQGIFLAGIGIGPAPHVVAAAARRRAERDQVHVREQIDIVAGIALDDAVHAFTRVASRRCCGQARKQHCAAEQGS